MASPSLSERDKAFEHLQEVFKGKVDADVIYLVFMESKWQGINHDVWIFLDLCCLCVTYKR